MTGLTLARLYFDEWGLPFLQRSFPRIYRRMAAGLYGGSESIQADDVWSRDHDWGGRFDLWLTDQDYRAHGRHVRSVMDKSAPREFEGHKHSFFGEDKSPVAVDSISGFFRGTFAWPSAPTEPRDWFRKTKWGSLLERSSWLYFLRRAPVFYDPLGEFSKRREAFARFPPDVRYRVIADTCLGIWGDGEYKFCNRFVHRKDPTTNQIVLADFARGVMRLTFYLEDDFAPHSFWLPHEFRRLPSSRPLTPLLNTVLGTYRLSQKADAVLHIGIILRNRMVRMDMIKSAKASYGLGYEDIRTKITDKWIKGLPPITTGR